MKKLMALLCTACLLGACFAGCGRDNPPAENDKLVKDSASIKYGFEELYKNNELKDEGNGFKKASDITGARFLVNGEYKPQYTEFSSRQDVKMEFYNGSKARLVNVSGGMAFTVPASGALEIDYSIAKYRTQITLGDSILTASAESSNPYTSTTDPWGLYRDEWLLLYLNSDAYIEINDLERTSEVVYEDTETRPGYEMYMYSIKINDESGNFERPYYNIGVIREENENIRFGHFVMKSKVDRTEDMKNILMSYNRIAAKGVMKNYYDAGAPQENPNWNQATKDYYKQINADNHINWGVFSYSMPGDEASLNPGGGNYDKRLRDSLEMQQGFEAAWESKFEIYPTYTHIGGYGVPRHHFPVQMAEELAGGDGTNGKPVLQFTYQFTTNDNNAKSNITPMFDIMRGVYDDHFERLAKDIKAYGKPVLFRLNNEMNTDWTSYCGMLTLNDPDIFQMTWRKLYKIFEANGVDNCIWIWNPIAISCPYSSWGEDLCYNPGAEYVQLLGLTDYEMNNYQPGDSQTIKSFDEKYSALYVKNKPAWGKYRAIISEFACGSGGNADKTILGRNAETQAQWVRDMFANINAANKKDYIKQIVGAIWFNCNDGSDNNIGNRLQIFDPATNEYDDLADTMEAFREGLNP